MLLIEFCVCVGGGAQWRNDWIEVTLNRGENTSWELNGGPDSLLDVGNGEMIGSGGKKDTFKFHFYFRYLSTVCLIP